MFPVLGNKYFISIDGPAHLYNANLLKQYWFLGKNELLNFYEINVHLNPNWFIHIWYSIAGTVLPACYTEKSFLIFYIIILPVSFRFLLFNLSQQTNSTKLFSYLIFPFIYSFPFRMGFYNFSIGIPILFFSLSYWIKFSSNFNLKKVIILLLLATTLYFTHILNFILFGFILCVYELQNYLAKKNLKLFFSRFKYLLIVVSPGFAFSVFYLLTTHQQQQALPKYIDKIQLLIQLFNFQSLITLNQANEEIYTRIYFFAFCTLSCCAIYYCYKTKQLFSKSIVWLTVSFVCLLFYFLFPDWFSSGGFITIRWQLFFFLFFAIWINTFQINPKVLLFPIGLLLITSLIFLNYHYKVSTPFSKDIDEMVETGEHIEEGKTLLPLNYSDNWMYVHSCNYIGAERNIFVLDNYEPSTPHFPLLYKKGENIYNIMPSFGNRISPCINIEKYEKITKHKIDYLSQWCFNSATVDSCALLIESELKNNFKLIYVSTSKKMLLYKRTNY